MSLPIIPRRGTDIQRRTALAAGRLLARELTTTTDQKRVFLGGEVQVGPAYLGSVASEAAMLALNSGRRGCLPMDKCYRTDTSSVWLCIGNRGGVLTDWINVGSGGGGGGAGDVVGPAASVAGELPLFDGATGKLLKRANGNGFVKATAGVASFASEIGTGDIAAGAVTYAKLQNIGTSSRLLGRKSSGAGSAEELTTSELLDFIGATRGSLLYRGASGWAILAPGAVGQVVKSNGVGADPSYGSVAGTGDVVGPAGATNETLALFDGTTGKLLKGQTVATISAGRLKVKSNGVSQMVHAVDDSGSTQADITATTYGLDGGGIFHGRLANGTEASPTKVTSGQIVGGFGARAYYGTTGFHASSPASIHMVAAETQENSAWGMYLRFLTTPIGSTTRNEAVLITPDGTLWAHPAAGTYDPKVAAQTKPFGDVNILSSSSAAGSAVASVAYGGNSAGFRGGSAGGSIGAPSATPADALIAFMGGHVYDGSAWTAGTKALLSFKAAQNASASNQGTYIVLETTPLNSTARAEVARITTNVLIGTTDETTATPSGGGNLKVLNSIILAGGGTGRGIRYAATTANGSVATTMGSVGPSGATAGSPSGWFRMWSGTANRDVFVPFW